MNPTIKVSSLSYLGSLSRGWKFQGHYGSLRKTIRQHFQHTQLSGRVLIEHE